MNSYYRITDSICHVGGTMVGHVSDFEGFTGCTAIIFPDGAVGGVDIGGFSTSMRQGDPLQLVHRVEKIYGVCFTGGSAFGLEATSGIMTYLEECGIGFKFISVKIPSIPGGAIYDLGFGDPKARPTKEMGYNAAKLAHENEASQGSVGAGVGATVGKFYGVDNATKGGLGSICLHFKNGIKVGALVVVNAFGDIIDRDTKTIVAGARSRENPAVFIDTASMYLSGKDSILGDNSDNTTLVIVVTNARLNKIEATIVAKQAQRGIFESIRPVHTIYDGDILIVASVGDLESDLTALGIMASESVSLAIKKAIMNADGFGILPAARELKNL